jgi:hypothetical protein
LLQPRHTRALGFPQVITSFLPPYLSHVPLAHDLPLHSSSRCISFNLLSRPPLGSSCRAPCSLIHSSVAFVHSIHSI